MKRKLKTVSYIFLTVVVTVLAVVLLRTSMLNTPEEKTGSPLSVAEPMTESVERFRGALRIPTVSNAEYEKTDFAPFDSFVVYLAENYTFLGKELEMTRVNNYGLVFRWKGKNSAKNPILFTAHYDVVPVSEQTAHLWKHSPFGAEVEDGKIYSRGTLDDKCSVVSILEAVNMLISSGFSPDRDVYFAFGHDEETGGHNGAKKIAEYFADKGLRFDLVLDEGGVVASRGTGGIDADMALVGIAEKGNVNVSVKVRKEGGHSSMPASVTALGAASSIITRLEKYQFEPRIIPPVYNMLSNVCHTMGFAAKMAVANISLFEPVLLGVLTSKPSTNAMVRTTTAVTMISGSPVPNVLPQEVEFVANFRILPGETVDDVVEHVKEAAEGYETTIKVLQGNDPSAISPTDVPEFDVLSKTIEKYYPNAIVTPYLTMAATDSRHYYAVSDNVYRFMPAQLSEQEQGLMHGVDEYISIDNFKRMICFYKDFISAIAK